MDIRRFASGTIVGAVTLHIVGYLIFEVALSDFYLENAGPATNAFRAGNVQWALALANLSFAALITLAVMSRTGALTIGRGFVTGLVIGFLVWSGVDLVYYGLTHLWSLTVVIVDPLLEAIRNGIAGAIIALVLAKIPKKTE